MRKITQIAALLVALATPYRAEARDAPTLEQKFKTCERTYDANIDPNELGTCLHEAGGNDGLVEYFKIRIAEVLKSIDNSKKLL